MDFVKLFRHSIAFVAAGGLLAAAVATTAAAASDRGRTPSPAAAVALPGSIAALGDSITQAFDATPTSKPLQNQPQLSWSTGYSSAVNSQYARLLKAGDSKVKGHERDDAVTGSQMNDLLAQATEAVGQKAAYVTILMGANDLCTKTVSTMTSVSTFTSEFKSALSELQKTSGIHIFVASIPNLYRLWSTLHTNASAENIWNLAGICQSMLSKKGTATMRHEVLTREEAFNSALKSVCKTFANCRFDQLKVFDAAFTATDVSTLDYFHPSIAGQNQLASLTWAASYWASKK